MCDIYLAPCQGCGADMDMHIGDFSCDRDAVTAWCPDCAKRAVPPTPDARRFEEEAEWWKEGLCWESALRSMPPGERNGRREPGVAVLFCSDARGHGIHLN